MTADHQKVVHHQTDPQEDLQADQKVVLQEAVISADHVMTQVHHVHLDQNQLIVFHQNANPTKVEIASHLTVSVNPTKVAANVNHIKEETASH